MTRMPMLTRLGSCGMAFGLGLLWLVGLTGCPSKVPTEGTFPVKVIALTSNKVGIPNAKVMINKKLLGQTDQFGTFLGTYRGRVKARVKIRVEGPGPENFMIVTSRLRLRKTKHGMAPAEIKVEAFLRGGGDSATPGDPADPSMAGAGAVPPPTKVAQAKAPAVPPPTRESAIPEPRPEARRPEVRRPEPRPEIRRPEPRPEIRRPEPRRQRVVEPRVDPSPATPDPPVAKPSGKYKVTAVSNVAGSRVYNGRRYLGKIRDAGGALSFTHRDRRTSPRPLTLTFRVNGSAYKENKITKEVTITTDTTDYRVEANFEKRTPFKILVKANVAGAKVKMNGRTKGTISTPETPLELEYLGKPTKVRIEIYPPRSPRSLRRQRRIRKYVELMEGTYEYNVDGEFKLPNAAPPAAPPTLAQNPTTPPPAARNDGPPLPSIQKTPKVPVRREPLVAAANPTTPEPKFSGIYKIMVSSNAAGTRVYKNGRSVGTIADAGGTLEITHKDTRRSPRRLTFMAKNSGGYTSSKVTKRVPLMRGQETYQVQFEFAKKQPIQIMAKANVAGVKIRMNGKPVGEVTSAGQAVPLEYLGSSKRVTVVFYAPGGNYKPSKVTRRVSLRGGTTFNVDAAFEEVVNDAVMTPNCFRRKRSRRVVMLMAKPGTTFRLKGNCNESLGRANKKGYLRVNMPKGSFQRVVASFPGGGSGQKVVDVGSGSTAMRVSIASGGKKCNLTRIRKKIMNKIFLEQEEVACLRNVKRNNSAYFSSQIALSRFYCQKKGYMNGVRVMDVLSRNPRNRFNPYRALQMGMEYGRCKKFRKALSLLKQAERMRTRFRPSDKNRNSKALFFAMADFYERKYYSGKNVTDLRQALRAWQRYGEIARDGASKSRARKESARLKGKLGGLGGGLDD